ncbi:hypothetical protein V1477_000513 [Vespula maculifrons]|uniref:PilZ domain-containing protein n=1 Tax=Vespula maculifrons TaxID=7453 RepID=A0ABD2D1T5_VESMC
MSEADGVDSGAICKRGFIHLQFAEKPEAPEAERHLERECRVESPLARGSSDAATSTRWDLGRKGMSPCFRTRMIGKTLTRVTAGTRVGVREREIKSYRGLRFVLEIPKDRHDRSCLEMSEADGVDSGAICKRGFIHLQFAEKPEAPEAERHLGSWILE